VTIQPGFAQDPDELFDVVNEDGSPTGIVKRRADVHRDGDWHRAIHVWVWGVDDTGPYLLLNLRGREKDTFPGLLDVTVGGHLAAGETVEEAFREIEEEIGITPDPARFRYLGTRRAFGDAERELQEVYLYRDNRPLGTFRPNPAELEGLVKMPLGSALALFGKTVARSECVVLVAGSRAEQQFAVGPEHLLPARFYPYYLGIAREIEQLLKRDAPLLQQPVSPHYLDW